MSEPPASSIDPESPRPIGDLSRFTRRRFRPARLALAALLALVITAMAVGALALIAWAIAGVLR